MLSLTYLLRACGDIAIFGLQIGWPLLIIALGLAGAAYFGGEDRIKTISGWIIALGDSFSFY